MKKTINRQATALPDVVKAKLRQLALDGKPITVMAEKSKLEYAVVQAYLWQSGNLPWQGAKNIIARRLRSLRSASKRAARDVLADDIQEQVNYLYYAARQLGAQLDKVKKSL